MKAIVIGSLLLHGLNAQLLDDPVLFPSLNTTSPAIAASNSSASGEPVASLDSFELPTEATITTETFITETPSIVAVFPAPTNVTSVEAPTISSSPTPILFGTDDVILSTLGPSIIPDTSSAVETKSGVGFDFEPFVSSSTTSDGLRYTDSTPIATSDGFYFGPFGPLPTASDVSMSAGAVATAASDEATPSGASPESNSDFGPFGTAPTSIFNSLVPLDSNYTSSPNGFGPMGVGPSSAMPDSDSALVPFLDTISTEVPAVTRAGRFGRPTSVADISSGPLFGSETIPPIVSETASVSSPMESGDGRFGGLFQPPQPGLEASETSRVPVAAPSDLNPFSSPIVPENPVEGGVSIPGFGGLSAPDTPGAAGAGGSSPGKWTGGPLGWGQEDHGFYDGEDDSDDEYWGRKWKNGKKGKKGKGKGRGKGYNSDSDSDSDSDEECPSWCQYNSGSDDEKPWYGNKGLKKYKGPKTLKKYRFPKKEDSLIPKRRRHARDTFGSTLNDAWGISRASAPPSSGGFQGFTWPKKKSSSPKPRPQPKSASGKSGGQPKGSSDYNPYGNEYPYAAKTPYGYDSPYDQNVDYDDAGEDDLPQWLKDLQNPGKKGKPTRPKCPARCKKTGKGKSTTKSSTGSPNQTTLLTVPTAAGATTFTGSWDDSYDQATTVTITSTSTSTTTATADDEDTSTTAAPAVAEFTPTTLITTTSTTTPDDFAAQATPGAAAPGYVTEGDTWTGDSLANICPKTCNPFDPALNKCGTGTGCTTTGGSHYYCACRAGYRLNDYAAKNFAVQFHVPGQPYVYTAPGLVCDTLCSDSLCSEVMTRPKCL
ncbi:hypothetical protein BS50DRAFT_581199 [Corynespora cassiicola Philippines]|uniref:EGF-like domain-containing protein n=1 Tax=Corynespora cassiicola Philippines TaxID=1448308 RepID=A0A2T2P9Q3_CORCC|nr:hypothetical protein BS50DRAFT_581199 [Corynespora cassiicola Philippines]